MPVLMRHGKLTLACEFHGLAPAPPEVTAGSNPNMQQAAKTFALIACSDEAFLLADGSRLLPASTTIRPHHFLSIDPTAKLPIIGTYPTGALEPESLPIELYE